jgi:hypothetical protein
MVTIIFVNSNWVILYIFARNIHRYKLKNSINFQFKLKLKFQKNKGVEPTKNNEPHRLVVKQSYTSRCDEKASEHFKNFNVNILKEKSRMIKSDGSVIKFMNNNNVEVRYYLYLTFIFKLTSFEFNLFHLF